MSDMKFSHNEIIIICRSFGIVPEFDVIWSDDHGHNKNRLTLYKNDYSAFRDIFFTDFEKYETLNEMILDFITSILISPIQTMKKV